MHHLGYLYICSFNTLCCRFTLESAVSGAFSILRTALCTQQLSAATPHTAPHTPPRSRAGQAGPVEKIHPCLCHRRFPPTSSLPQGCSAAVEHQQQRQQPPEPPSFSRATEGSHASPLASSRSLYNRSVSMADSLGSWYGWRRCCRVLKLSFEKKSTKKSTKSTTSPAVSVRTFSVSLHGRYNRGRGFPRRLYHYLRCCAWPQHPRQRQPNACLQKTTPPRVWKSVCAARRKHTCVYITWRRHGGRGEKLRVGWTLLRAIAVAAAAAAELRNAPGSSSGGPRGRPDRTIDAVDRDHHRTLAQRSCHRQAGCQPCPRQAGTKHRAGSL